VWPFVLIGILLAAAIVAVIALVAGGGDDNATTAETSEVTTTVAEPTTATSAVPSSAASTSLPGTTAAAPAVTTAPVAVGPRGSATYSVSGGYSSSGELPLLQNVANAFDGDGWLLTFGSGNGQGDVLQVATVGGTFVATFSNGGVIIGGSGDAGCTSNLTRNDASGVEGTFSCSGVPGLVNHAPTTVDFSGTVTVAG